MNRYAFLVHVDACDLVKHRLPVNWRRDAGYGIFAAALTALGDSLMAVASLLAAWGLIGTAAPVAWWTWLSKALPRDAERGGGLMVAVVQLAITLGATVGGLVYDLKGYQSTFGVSAAILCASAVLAYLGWHAGAKSSD